MSRLQVVMPMAGRGQRFLDAHFQIPKPLILVDGKPMFVRALDSIEGLESDLFLIIRKDINDTYNLANEIVSIYPEASITTLDAETRGAAETVMSVTDLLNLEAPLLILDCDLLFESTEFLELINRGQDLQEDGLLLSFKSNDSRYSYVKSEKDLALKVKEKEVISERALIGAYYWKTAGNFLKYAQQSITDGITVEQREFYISSALQKAIESGLKFRVLNGNFYSFGTPEELANYARKSI